MTCSTVCLLYNSNHCGEIQMPALLTLICQSVSVWILIFLMLFLGFKRFACKHWEKMSYRRILQLNVNVQNIRTTISLISNWNSRFLVLTDVIPKGKRGRGDAVCANSQDGAEISCRHKVLVETVASLSCLCLCASVHCLKQTKLHGDRGFLSARFPFTLITH